MRLDSAAFEQLVAKAVDDLPGWVRDRMDNVAILVVPWPSANQMPRPGSPRGDLLLGLYEGVPLTKRGRGYGLTPPDRITLFQGPLELCARDPQALLQLIRRTIVHEVAHHFGFSEARIRELGY